MGHTKEYRISSRLVTLASLAIILLSCKENKSNISCDTLNKKSSTWLYEYYTTHDKNMLDSACFYTEKGIINCDKHSKTFILRKLCILSEQNEFLVAVRFIESLDNPLFYELPYYNSLLLHRFKAMNATFKETNVFDENINKCNSILANYFENHSMELDSIIHLTNIDDILSNPMSTALTQYFQYKYFAEKDNVLREFLNLKNDSTINQEFIQYLELAMDDDILEFIGI